MSTCVTWSEHYFHVRAKRKFTRFGLWVHKLWNACMMTSSNGSILRVTGPLWGEPPVTGGFPSQWPITQSFDFLIDLRPNKRLNKNSSRRWFETRSLYYDVTVMFLIVGMSCRFTPVRVAPITLFSIKKNPIIRLTSHTTSSRIFPEPSWCKIFAMTCFLCDWIFLTFKFAHFRVNLSQYHVAGLGKKDVTPVHFLALTHWCIAQNGVCLKQNKTKQKPKLRQTSQELWGT